MPVMKGLDFIEKQLERGCQCRHLALMPGDYTQDDLVTGNDPGLKFFQKPFDIADVFEWLDQIEKEINPRRQLTEYNDLKLN